MTTDVQMVQRAQQFLDQGNIPEALEAANLLVGSDLDPSHEHLFLRARIRGLWGDKLGAKSDLERAISAKPTIAAYYVELGEVLAASSDLEGASLQFQRAIRIDPQNERAKFGSLSCLTEDAEMARAVAELSLAPATDPLAESTRRNTLATIHLNAIAKSWYPVSDELLCPVNGDDLAVAANVLAKVRALDPPSAGVKKQAARFAQSVLEASKRQYGGGIGATVGVTLLGLLCLSSGGPLGLTYALSAGAFFYAFRVPGYIRNRHLIQGASHLPYGERIADALLGGSWGTSSTSILGVITGQMQLMAVLKLIRVAVLALALPLTVASALARNYSWRHAGAFAALCFAVIAGARLV